MSEAVQNVATRKMHVSIARRDRINFASFSDPIRVAYARSLFIRRRIAVHTLTTTVATYQIVDRSINSIGTPNFIIYFWSGRDFRWSGLLPGNVLL
jgi:hypothetical protein